MNTPRENTWAFIRNFAATCAALFALCAWLWFIIEPRSAEFLRDMTGADELQASVDELAAQGQETQEAVKALQSDTVSNQRTVATISSTQEKMAATLESIVNRVVELERSSREEITAPIRFATGGHDVTNGHIGGLVSHTWDFYKTTRDCGAPRSIAQFKDASGSVHIFEDKSNAGPNGLSTAAPISPDRQTIKFVARIPDGVGVETGEDGYARAFIVIDWPEKCPQVRALTSPEVLFRILPKE